LIHTGGIEKGRQPNTYGDAAPGIGVSPELQEGQSILENPQMLLQ